MARTGRILERASFALAAADQAVVNPGVVPTVGPIPMLKFQPRPVDEVRSEAHAWVIGCALRDFVEEVAGLLEETRRVCTASTLVGSTIVSEEFLGTVDAQKGEFDRLTFPAKVERIQKLFGDVLDGRIRHVRTLVRARNCLVHRLGVVDERDCNEGEVLVIRWKDMELGARTPDGREVPLMPGTVLKEGGQPFVRYVERSRQFACGERVVLTSTDLCGIWRTLEGFAYGTTKRVVDFAREKGVQLKGTGSRGRSKDG